MMWMCGRRRRSSWIVLAAGAAAGLSGRAWGQTQWTVINLHPAGETSSRATGVWETQQAGTVAGTAGQRALVWRGWSESGTVLSPAPGVGSSVSAAWGGQQGGTVQSGQESHAAIWSGSAQSLVDLHPTHVGGVVHSSVHAVDGQSQVGSYYIPNGGMFAGGLACMWSGTAQSWVDLHPVGFFVSEAHGVLGEVQVGTAWGEDLGNAVMWMGSAESAVLLAPPEALASAALCLDENHQYGMIGVLEPVPGLYPARWSGTAESWENMGVPEGRWGEIHAVHGGWKVGFSTSAGDVDERAYLWTDGPGSYVDLHEALGSEYATSNAQGIWRHAESGTAYIVGYAHNSVRGQDEAIMWVTGPGVNLITGAAGAGDCAAAVGEEMVFRARVVNAGAEAAGAVTLTVALPPASVATFVGSTPAPSSVSPTEVTIDLGSLAALGGAAEVTVTLAAVGAGQTAEVVFSASAAGEVHAANNTASAASRIVPAPATAAGARGVFSTDIGLANSLVPGGGGEHFAAFDRPIASPGGNWWVMRANTDLGVGVMLRSGPGSGPEVILREGSTATSNGTLTAVTRGAEVNDEGLVAFGGTDDGAPGTRNFVATTSGAGITEVVREGQQIAALDGFTYGAGLGGSVNLLESGAVGFYTNTSPLSAAYLSDNGATVIAQRHVTLPEGSVAVIESLDSNSAGTGGIAFDPSGEHHIYGAVLGTGADEDDGAIVVDGVLVIQEGFTVLPGMASPVVMPSPRLWMGTGGVWLARGSTVEKQGWVAQGTGPVVTRVFKEGDPIHAGATEVWRSEPDEPLFFVQTGDGAGNILLGGTTDAADWRTNAVLVYNDEVVVARENDPVDLDGNGAFDDGVYIRSFEADTAALVPGAVLVVVTLRDEAAALCGAGNEAVGTALVRIGLPGGGCPSDWNGDGSVNSTDISAFLAGWLTSLQGGTLEADFNGDGQVNSTDISAFLTAWLEAVQGGC